MLIFPSSAAVFTFRPCRRRLYICVGKLAAINCKALYHGRMTITRTASLPSYNSSFAFNCLLQPIVILVLILICLLTVVG